MPIQSVQNDRSALTAGGLQDQTSSIGSQRGKGVSDDDKNAPGPFTFDDQYVKSDEENKSPFGLYQLVKDEDGNPQIIVDGAKPRKSDAGNPADDKPKDSPDKPAGKKDGGKLMKCTVNTDKVDAEIKKLKQEKQKLQQEIQRSATDEDKVNELKTRLFEIVSELHLKDNDSYRKQNSTYSFS